MELGQEHMRRDRERRRRSPTKDRRREGDESRERTHEGIWAVSPFLKLQGGGLDDGPVAWES